MPEPRRRFAVVEDVVTVRVVLAVVPDGVTVEGEKLHDAPTGRPVQLKETVDAKPLSDVMETVVEALCPAANVSAGNEVVTEKSPAGRLIV